MNCQHRVATQNIILKLIDSVIASHSNLQEKTKIDEMQHEFVNGKSTTTNLIESEPINNIKRWTQTDAIHLDIFKAFHSVNVELLLRKQYHGIE